MAKDFHKAQTNLVKALEDMYGAGGFLEKGRVCACTKELHRQVFALSYEDVYKRSKALLRKCGIKTD